MSLIVVLIMKTRNMLEIFRTTKDTQRLDYFFDDNHDDHDIDEAWSKASDISPIKKTTKDTQR